MSAQFHFEKCDLIVSCMYVLLDVLGIIPMSFGKFIVIEAIISKQENMFSKKYVQQQRTYVCFFFISRLQLYVLFHFFDGFCSFLRANKADIVHLSTQL